MTKINTHANGLPSGLYVLRTSKEEIRARIEAIPSRFVDVVGNRQIVNTYKTTRNCLIGGLFRRYLCEKQVFEGSQKDRHR